MKRIDGISCISTLVRVNIDRLIVEHASWIHSGPSTQFVVPADIIVFGRSRRRSEGNRDTFDGSELFTVQNCLRALNSWMKTDGDS